MCKCKIFLMAVCKIYKYGNNSASLHRLIIGSNKEQNMYIMYTVRHCRLFETLSIISINKQGTIVYFIVLQKLWKPSIRNRGSLHTVFESILIQPYQSLLAYISISCFIKFLSRRYKLQNQFVNSISKQAFSQFRILYIAFMVHTKPC